MKGYLTALAFAALPALGNFAGGLLAEAFNVSRRTLSFALHAAAGIILAVVGVELMPQALEVEPPWVIVLAFVAGGGFFILMDTIIERIQERGESEGGSSSGAWAIFFGVAVDLFSDGVMIGAGSTVGFGLGLLLALGQVPADIPEGFATIATFKQQGVARAKRLLLAASFAVPILLGTTIGYWAVRGAPEIVKMSLLAFTAGILLSVSIEEIVTEAHREEDSRWATVCLVGGFALFVLLSIYLGD